MGCDRVDLGFGYSPSRFQELRCRYGYAFHVIFWSQNMDLNLWTQISSLSSLYVLCSIVTCRPLGGDGDSISQFSDRIPIQSWIHM